MQGYNLPAGTRAQASLPCIGNSQGCFVRFNDNPSEVAFYTGVNTTIPAGQVDMWSVAAHELGHWGGLGDLTTDDRPASGNNASPTMLQGLGGSARRTIEQDDMNGFHHSRPGSLNILANRSLEYASPLSWRFLGSANGGNFARYCDPPNAYSGSCFGQFNGNGIGGASMIQDVIPRGPGATVLYPSVRLRNNGTSGVPATLAVFWTGGQASVNCTLPPGSWVNCGFGLPVSLPNSDSVIFQIINYGGGNISYDLADMGAN